MVVRPRSRLRPSRPPRRRARRRVQRQRALRVDGASGGGCRGHAVRRERAGAGRVPRVAAPRAARAPARPRRRRPAAPRRLGPRRRARAPRGALGVLPEDGEALRVPGVREAGRRHQPVERAGRAAADERRRFSMFHRALHRVWRRPRRAMHGADEPQARRRRVRPQPGAQRGGHAAVHLDGEQGLDDDVQQVHGPQPPHRHVRGHGLL
mmetsp:Transcript_27964/g.96655  ORF Transcript_27964/g.96655 Transcript_27964/m.96655 type:complete len:209 (-) Transcript_27964:1097-1723(-)